MGIYQAPPEPHLWLLKLALQVLIIEFQLGKSVCSILLDAQKAFDSVPHAILVNKLRSHGLNVYLLRWICDYFVVEISVVLNGGPQPLPSGVSQGSVLGPFLFTLYINNLADLQLSEGSKLVAYVMIDYCTN